MTTTLYWRGRLCGWIMERRNQWLALTPKGVLTHHNSSLEAMECLQQSLPSLS